MVRAPVGVSPEEKQSLQQDAYSLDRQCYRRQADSHFRRTIPVSRCTDSQRICGFFTSLAVDLHDDTHYPHLVAFNMGCRLSNGIPFVGYWGMSNDSAITVEVTMRAISTDAKRGMGSARPPHIPAGKLEPVFALISSMPMPLDHANTYAGRSK